MKDRMSDEYQILEAIYLAIVEAVEASKFKIVKHHIIDENDYNVDETTGCIVVRSKFRRRVWIYVEREGILLEMQNAERLLTIPLASPNCNPGYVIDQLHELFAYEKRLAEHRVEDPA